MFGLAVHNPKNSQNIGHLLRAAHAYKADFVLFSGDRQPRCATNVSKAHMEIPTIHTDDIFKSIPYGCVPIAVELTDSAKDLRTFAHPENVIYIFGAEDATLGKRTLDRCKDVVYIPTEICMNLAACANVVLYDRLLKSKLPKEVSL